MCSITNLLGFHNLRHHDIPFVDIIPYTDIGLYLDPILIDSSEDPFIKNCSNTIDDFFSCVAEACESKDYESLSYLLRFGREKNATHLGMAEITPYGKGASPEILERVFMTLSKAYQRAASTIPRPSALNVLIKNFGDDRMSDLLTNILLGKLYEFTDSIKDEYNIPQEECRRNLGYYWNVEEHSWCPLIARPFVVDGIDFILVPKNIVRSRLCCTVSSYLWHRYIPRRQDYHQENRTSLSQRKYSRKKGFYVAKPTKKMVYSAEISGQNTKDIANDYFNENPESFDSLIDEFIFYARQGKYTMLDSELDRIVANKLRKIS